MNNFINYYLRVAPFFCLACLCLIFSKAFATEVQSATNPSAEGIFLKAQSALEVGLPNLAARHLEGLLDQKEIDPGLRESIQKLQIDAALACEKFDQAAFYLQQYGGSKGASYRLRVALVAYGQGDWKAIEGVLQDLQPEHINGEERAWFYLIKGLFDLHEKHLMAAEEAFLQAAKYTQEGPQLAWIEAIRLEYAVHYGAVDEALLKELEQKLSKSKFKSVDERMIENYAIALATVGREDEALDVLEKAIRKNSSWDKPTQAKLYFLMGLLGKNSPRGWAAFQKLIQGNFSLSDKRNALYRISLSQPPEAFEPWIDEILKNFNDNDPLLGDALLLKAALSFDRGQLDQSYSDAERVAKGFPDLKIRALEMLASISWAKGQYRTAANYFDQWRKELPSSSPQSFLSAWMGDAYFMAEDWDSASAAYREALILAEDSQKGRLVGQVLLSDLNQNKIEEALSLLKNYPADRPEFRQAYWLVLQAGSQKLPPAWTLEKIREWNLLQHFTYPLKGHLMLLYARCLWKVGDALEACDAVQNAFKSMASEEDPLMEEILSEALLLEGEILFSLKDALLAKQAFTRLRSAYKDTKAAELSYLVEGRFCAQEGRIVDAQEAFMECVTLYPSSTFTPIALFEAAILAANRGLKGSTHQSLQLLEQLVKDFPAHPLVLSARLEQGKILCGLGDFEAALIVYGSLKIDKNSHEWEVVQMAKAQYFMAQLPEKTPDAIEVFERLLDRKTLSPSLRAEASYKLAYVRWRQSKLDIAEQIYWGLAEPFLKNLSEAFGAEGYWVSRALLDLGEILEQRQDFQDASSLYQNFLKINLPGKEIVRSRLEKIVSNT